MSLKVAQAQRDDALSVHPLHLLEVLGEEGCALRYNPGRAADWNTGNLEAPEGWEVWIVDELGPAIPTGFGASPVAALVDAAVNLLGFEDEGCVLEAEVVDLALVDRAVSAVRRFLREARGEPEEPYRMTETEVVALRGAEGEA